MLTKNECLEVLKIDDKVSKCQSHIQLFKKDTILLYVGRAREAKGIVVTGKNEKWVGLRDIFNRQFGYIVDFILGEGKINTAPQIGDILYLDPFVGELTPMELEGELLYFKVVKLDEINLLIK